MKNKFLLILAGGAALTVIIGIKLYVFHTMYAPTSPSPGTLPTQPPTTFAPFEPPRRVDVIRVETPKRNEIIASPFMVQGQARGSWYFEATFPVRLLDGNGKEIAHTAAHAQGEWMTTDFVPFSATLTFTTPITDEGILMLEKDNPSGLPQNADEFPIPVRFR